VAPGADAPDPIALLALAPPDAPRFYWSAPDDDWAMAAFGAARVVTAAGAGRLPELSAACTAAMPAMAVLEIAAAGVGDLAHLVGAVTGTAAPVPSPAFPVSAWSDGADPPHPRWIGGFAFEDGGAGEGAWSEFPAAGFWLPAVSLACGRWGVRLTLAAAADAAGDLAARARDVVEALSASAVLRSALTPLPPLPKRRGRGGESHGREGGGTSAGAEPSSVIADAEMTSARDAWLADVADRAARVVAAIRRGEAAKVVLAASRTVDTTVPLDPLAVLSRLRAAQPGCFHFMIAPRPGLALVGATPERLVRVRGDRVETVALAGSARRDVDPAVDGALGSALLASAKDRVEHELVVRAIVATLGAHAIDVEAPPEPRLRRLATIQHLETPIGARLAGPGDVLALAARLHPTPAVGGTPREAALGVIRAVEAGGRGWYAGGVGWLNGRGDGDLAVAIRSVLIAGRAATAYAGAGIVAASDPAAEAREIALKLEVALGAVRQST